ncbi:MAG: SsrA-binding protein SmpB [Acidimicrobiia bacterium]
MMKIVTTNRRATHDYEILERFEAGMVLDGSEVKSLREGKANLKDSFAWVKRGEVFLVGAYIAPYTFARDGGHLPERERKLLLHRHEIDHIASKLAEKGLTLVPMKLYFKDGTVKAELGLGRGKNTVDKRQSLKERESKREMQRALRRASR